MRRLPLLPLTSANGNMDVLVEFDNHVHHLVDERAAKDAGKTMKDVLFAEWRVNNPPSPPS
jgi:hypothetical protein